MCLIIYLFEKNFINDNMYEQNNNSASIIAIVIIVIILILCYQKDKKKNISESFMDEKEVIDPDELLLVSYPFINGEREKIRAKRVVPPSIDSLDTVEVDPLITGRLYAAPRAAGEGKRYVYGGQVSHGNKWGLREFSNGISGEVGVDIGPNKHNFINYDIPKNWRLPSDSIPSYETREDSYNIKMQGPAVSPCGGTNIKRIQEPDHNPLVS